MVRVYTNANGCGSKLRDPMESYHVEFWRFRHHDGAG